MDFLKKAKSKLNEIEGDLTKATQAFGLGDKKDEALATSSSTGPSDVASPQSTSQNTPSTSVAPSTIASGPKTKLPLAIRKHVRDEYEVKIPEMEANLTKMLGVPWRLEIDPVAIYAFAEDRYSKEQPGEMITKYVEGATNGISQYVEKYGDDGKAELLKLASAHVMTLEPVTTQDFSYCGCEISGGFLRLMFKKGLLGTNIYQVAEKLDTAVNKAGVASGGASALDFDARNGIKKNFDPAIGGVQVTLQRELALPVLTLVPNFEQNFAALDAFVKSGQSPSMWPRDWQKQFGGHTLTYFEGVAKAVENLGFGKDDMLQEGFKDAVEKNEISLRVVDKLVKGHYNEVHIENGVLYIQTTPEMWTTNIDDPANNLIDLL